MQTQTSTYPQLVKDMRELISYAVGSGDIENLALALDASIQSTRIILPNDSGAPAPQPSTAGETSSPLQALKALSHDGRGHDILARIGAVLDLPAAKLPLGADYENQDIYVWPYLAERPLGALTGSEIVDLYRVAPPAVADGWRDANAWRGDRVLIGADGAWLAFVAAPSRNAPLGQKTPLRQNRD